ncbi:MAG TPA: ATP-binding protein [Kineosporiaceae bacterium]|nr:ATP-binding protein [Kineosporiaceae bacterium]
MSGTTKAVPGAVLDGGPPDPDAEEWRGFTEAMGVRLSGVLLQAARMLGDGLFVTDASGGIIWANQAFLRVTGRPLGEVLGRRRFELSRGPVLAQQEQVEQELNALRPVSAQFPLRDGKGVTRWIALSAFPYAAADGRPGGLVGVERDLTEWREEVRHRNQALRRAESLMVALEHERRLLAMVLAAVPHVVWWKGADLRYTGCNEAYLRLRGLAEQLDLIGRTEGELGLEDGLGERLAGMERSALESGQAVVDVKITLENPARTFQFNVQPYLDAGQPAGVVGIGADVSHATELERQLAQANRLEAIGQLASGIAHEINTPVQYASDNTRFVAETMASVLAALKELDALVRNGSQPVQGKDGLSCPGAGATATGPGLPPCEAGERVAELLQSLDLPFVADEVPGALTQSLEGLERVTQIVRAMKEFSHPGQGRAPADLNRLVTSTVQVSRNEWKYVARLDMELDPGLGPVSCFEGDLKQVVLNIIVNAAHAVEERRRREHLERLGRITVATRRAGGEARITISDDGIGMDEATMSRVFDPFFTTKEVGKGTGQGLTLARSAVKKHGGRIEVSSQPGEGSSFSIILPVLDPGPGDLPVKEQEAGR